MANNRIFYANHAVGVGAQSVATFTEVHGLQSAAVNTNFNVEYVKEIGQLATYEAVEDIPSVEITLEKVLDGYPLIYHLCTQGASSDSLAGRGNVSCQVAVSIFDDDQDASSGTPLSQLTASGLFVNALRYEFPVDGNCTESVTLIGNNIEWKTAGFTFSGTLFDNTDEPLALTSGLGGVQRRENLVFAGSDLASVTRLPTSIGGIPGISASGTNDKTADVYGAHVQRISVATDLNREELRELGRKLFYFRAIGFPIDVTCDIEVLSTLGNRVDATEAGAVSGTNIPNQIIRVVTEEGTNIDLGTKNILRSVSYANGNADGGNVSDTYSYTNQNYLIVSHPQSP